MYFSIGWKREKTVDAEGVTVGTLVFRASPLLHFFPSPLCFCVLSIVIYGAPIYLLSPFPLLSALNFVVFSFCSAHSQSIMETLHKHTAWWFVIWFLGPVATSGFIHFLSFPLCTPSFLFTRIARKG